MRKLSFLAVIGTALVTACARPQAPADIERNLIASFETIVSADPVILTTRVDTQQSRPSAILKSPFAFFSMSTIEFGPIFHHELLASATRVIVGARDFRQPQDLQGLVQSRYCYAVLLRSNASVDFPAGTDRSQRAGRVIYSWMASAGESNYDNLVRHPVYGMQLPRLILVSNGIDVLMEAADAIENNLSAPTTVATRAEIDTHSLWAYRKYRHNVPEPIPAGMRHVTSGVDALLFTVDASQESATLKISGKSVETTAAALNTRRILPRLQPVGPGQVGATIRLTEPGDLSDQVAYVMALLGFGAYI